MRQLGEPRGANKRRPPKAAPDTVPDGATLTEALVTSYPSGYCRLRLGMTPYQWQEEAMDSLYERGTKTAIRTCNESGKTSLVIAGLVLWHMETFPGSLTITTSGSYNQIIHQLYPSLRAFSARRRGFRVMKDHATFEPTGSRLVSFSTDEAGRAEGWHEPPRIGNDWDEEVNPFVEWGVSDKQWEAMVRGGSGTSLLMVVDEAKSVQQEIFDAWERCHPTRLLIASSPGVSSGPFYDCFHAEKHRYKTFHIGWDDCPHLSESDAKRAEIEEQLKTKPKALTDSMVYGEFTSGESNSVFDMGDIDKAMSGLNPKWGSGSKRAAIDLSNGGDETCLYVRDGNEAMLVRTWRTADDDKLVSELIDLLKKWDMKPEWVYADDGGLGKIILNGLERRGWAVNRVNFGSQARDAESYRNTRAEMYFELSNRMRRGELRLPRDPELRDQLGWQRYKENVRPLTLEEKSKQPRSPDRADTVVMLYYDMPSASEFVGAERDEKMTYSRTITCGSDGKPLRPGSEESLDGATGLWAW